MSNGLVITSISSLICNLITFSMLTDDEIKQGDKPTPKDTF